MNDFSELKKQWGDQQSPQTPNEGAKSIIGKTAFLKKKQQITNGVLGTMVLILIGYFFYIAAYNEWMVVVGLLLMIGSLLIRIGIEYISIKNLKQISVVTDAITFKQKMAAYYKKRIKTHYIITPIIIIFYFVGFIILLPFFREALSRGFYNYIKISAIIIFVVMIYFIGKQIRKEISILKDLIA